MKKGYSVIEILVVVAVFAVLGVLATQSISLSLKSTKKGDSVVDVKQELDFAADNISRMFQMANEIYCPEATATQSAGFRDLAGYRGDIACMDTDPNFIGGGTDSRIASSSAESISYSQRLTSQRIEITSCVFICNTQNSKKYIDFAVSAKARGIPLEEGAEFSSSRKIMVKSFQKK